MIISLLSVSKMGIFLRNSHRCTIRDEVDVESTRRNVLSAGRMCVIGESRSEQHNGGRSVREGERAGEGQGREGESKVSWRGLRTPG